MKHTWNRLMSLALALTLLATLAACGTKQKDIAGTIEPGPSATAPTSTVETAPTPEVDEEEHPVSLGRIEGGVYTNSYAGFGCELDSNWEFYTADELQELPDSVKDALTDTDIGEAMSEMTIISDMKAENAEDLTTINVQYTKLSAGERVTFLALGEEELLDAMLEQRDMLISSYAQMDIEVESMEKAEVDFLGEKHWGLRTTATQYEVPCYMLQIFDYTRGSYSVTTTFLSYVEDTTEDLAGLFYKVD